MPLMLNTISFSFFFSFKVDQKVLQKRYVFFFLVFIGDKKKKNLINSFAIGINNEIVKQNSLMRSVSFRIVIKIFLRNVLLNIHTYKSFFNYLRIHIYRSYRCRFYIFLPIFKNI